MTEKPLSDYEFSAQLENHIRDLQLEQKDDRQEQSFEKELQDQDLENLNYKKHLEVKEDRMTLYSKNAFLVASLSGKIDPKALSVKGVSAEDNYQLLTRLLPYFELIEEKGEIKWCLGLSQREEVLTNLLKSNVSSDFEKRLPQTDAAGNILRALWFGYFHQNGLGYKTGVQHLSELVIALEWLQAIEINKPDLEQTRAQLNALQILPDQQILLRSGFIGRKKELGKIVEFITHGSTIKGNSMPTLVLGGIGGSGKSTLIAKLCKSYQGSNLASIIVLDFDKPGMSPNDTGWMDAEMTRQIAAQHPQLYKNLQKLRRQIRSEENLYPGNQTSLNQERDLMASMITGLRQELKSSIIGERPLILILDTYEEVIQQNLHSNITNWLSYLIEYLLPIQLKVIFSGRYSEKPDADLQLAAKTPFLPLNAFDKATTLAFLKNLNLEEKVANDVAHSKILPKRPLELKLLVKILQSDPRISVKDFERELFEGGGAELFLGLVYRRVLQRISNPIVRTMASPGLIMRFLTAEIIQQVLVPALNLPLISNNQAQEIIDALASYAWLAHRKDKYQVWHSKDLRRSMLRLMINNDPALAKEIHLHAIRYFRDNGGINGAHEVIYHQLMFDESEGHLREIKENDMKMAWPFLQGDLEDFPLKNRVYFRYVAKRSVRAEELYLLPEHLITTARRMVAQQLAIRGLYGKAFEVLYLIREKDRAAIMPEPNSEFQSFEVNILLNTGRWSALANYQSKFVRSKSIKVLIDLLYLYSVVNTIQHQDIFYLQDQISNHLNSALYSEKEILILVRPEVISKFLACLITLRMNNTLSDELYDICKKVEVEISNVAMEHKLLLKEAFLLKLLINKAKLNEFKLKPSMLPLMPRQLTQLLNRLSKDDKEIVEQYTKQLRDRQTSTPMAALRLLNELDKTFTPITLDLNTFVGNLQLDEVILILTGSFLEFRNPCKYVLLEALNRNPLWHEVIYLFADELKFVIHENYFHNQGNWEQKPELFLENLIELIDRTCKLPEFMEKIASLFPMDQTVEVITKALWDQQSIKAEYIVERITALH